MGNQTSEEDTKEEMSDAEYLYGLWREYELRVGRRKRNPKPGAGAIRCLNKGLSHNTRSALEIYFEYIYTSSDPWPCHLRVSKKYTQLDTLFRAQNAGKGGRRVKEALWKYILKNSIPEYAYMEVEWFESRGVTCYVDRDGKDKRVYGGQEEIDGWLRWASEVGIR